MGTLTQLGVGGWGGREQAWCKLTQLRRSGAVVVVTQIPELNDVSLIPKPMVSITLLDHREQSVHCFTIPSIPCVTSEATSHDHAVIGKSIRLQRTIHTSAASPAKTLFIYSFYF